MQLHHEMECPAYPAVSERCNKDGIPRAKVKDFFHLLENFCETMGRPQLDCRAGFILELDFAGFPQFEKKKFRIKFSWRVKWGAQNCAQE